MRTCCTWLPCQRRSRSTSPSMRQFWLFHRQIGLQSTGMRPRSHARFQMERASRMRLILDGTGQRGGEVLGACSYPIVRQYITVQSLHQHFDRADVFLGVRSQ